MITEHSFVKVEIFPKVKEITHLSPSCFEDCYRVSGKFNDRDQFHGFVSIKDLAHLLYPST